MNTYRDELLARTDLAALADELIGGRRGNGTAARWPSPVPDHPQTGRTPPMSIFRDRNGTERWTCWSSGQAGTAIDLVMCAHRVDVKAAIDFLANRTQHHAPPPPPPTPRTTPRTDPVMLNRYLTRAQRCLRTADGETARRWLWDRWAINTRDIVRHGLGLDTGRWIRGRSPAGAIVLPVHNTAAQATYYQLRLIEPGDNNPKYLNPSANMATNPHLGWTQPGRYGPLIICEGIPDAIAAQAARLPSVAIIGTGNAHRTNVISGIAERLDTAGAVIAFDADTAGQTSAQDLHDALTTARPDITITNLVPDHGDLAAWRRTDPACWANTLTQHLGTAPTHHTHQRPAPQLHL